MAQVAAVQRPTIVQFNLSPTLGGAEVYTASFSRALAARGWPTRVIVAQGTHFWNDLDFGSVRRDTIARASPPLPQSGDIIVVHAPVAAAVLATVSGRFLVGVAHQALYDGTRPAYYDRADMLLAVSRHVIGTLERYGLTRVHPTCSTALRTSSAVRASKPLKRARFSTPIRESCAIA